MNIENVIKELTLEQKASLCSGADFWHTETIDSAGIAPIMVSDGPNGLRKQSELTDHMGIAESVVAICFPTASAMASSFDTDLIYTIGQALGEECQSENVSVLLGPGINMKRTPLCGRNFEYYSEDPYLAGEIGTAFVNGVQSQNVGVSLKHFAANNQETKRLTIDVLTNERTLRETYLSAFEKVVKQAKPWTVMCSYNRINGVYSCENEWLLDTVLRKEWGFDGLVVTDWGAMNDRIKALKAGLDLEMPSSHGETDKQIVAAVKDGSLDEAVLDKAVRNILTLVDKSIEGHAKYLPANISANSKKSNGSDSSVNASFEYNKEEHHNLARRAASECAVLLKNDNSVLPLKEENKYLFIGEFAAKSKYQGGGSSHINSYNVESVLNALSTNKCNVNYYKGYNINADKSEDTALLNEVLSSISSNDTAVIFAGLPDSFESEGFDRSGLDMPDNQNLLIQEVSKKAAHTVVVLYNGSPVSMPWLDNVDSVLEMYLGGEAAGPATIDLLYGTVNPSGHLAETFPIRIEDTPAYLDFPGTPDHVCYNEGVFIGYRYYDKRKMPVLFPFGHGLSYTTFEYSDLNITSDSSDNFTYNVNLTIKNTGKIAGSEVVQLYVNNSLYTENRPEKELKGFKKIALDAGASAKISFNLDKRSFAFFNEECHDWFVPSGQYKIAVGSSSRDLRLCTDIDVKSDDKIPFKATDVSTCEDIFKHAKNVNPLEKMLEKSGFASSTAKDDSQDMGESTAKMMAAMFTDTPLHSIISFSGDDLTIQDIKDTIAAINEAEDN